MDTLPLNTLRHRTVFVLGLGDSGLAMARWCARQGASVRVWDSRAQGEQRPPQAAALAQQVPEAQWVLGDLAEPSLEQAALAGVDRVLKSPGLSPFDVRIAPLLAQARQRGVPVQGELELFVQALATLRAERGYAPKLLAITGTNGKTTTTAMTALLVERSGKRVAVAGNIGPTLLQTLADALDLEPHVDSPLPFDAPAPDALALPGSAADSAQPPPPAASAPVTPAFQVLPEVWVLELSSFQLDGVQGFEPDAGALLNLTQDHLDWHGDMAHYGAAKAHVFGQHAVLVVNRDDPAVEALLPAPPGRPAVGPGGAAAGKAARKAAPPPRQVLRFGLRAPQHPGDFGLVEEHGMAWLVRARELDETLRRTRGGKGRAGSPERAEPDELQIQRLMPADALRVRGRHNAANAMAALALASAIGCPLAPMLHGLRDYRGEPHRVEYLATVAGVDAFDDSKGTNVGATVAALLGLGADKAPARLAVILGGDGKGQDFGPLAEPVRRHARVVATLGQDAAAIEAALVDSDVPIMRHASLEAATRWCFEQARSGDAVLLSPACASLDMFRHYVHRAEVFAGVVRELAADRGELIA